LGFSAKNSVFRIAKVLEILKNFFQEVFKRVQGRALRLWGMRFSPRGAAPWNPASFFERKKQRSVHGRKLRFRQELFGIFCEKFRFSHCKSS